MQIEVNGNPVTIPTTLAEFTLGQRIAFQLEHGNDLDEMAKSIMEIEEEMEREMETMQFAVESAYRTFSFFSGVPVDIVKDSEFVDDVLSIYYACRAVLFEQEDQLELQTTFIWQNEEWELSQPILKQGDKMTFGELIDAKQMVQNMQQLSKSHWEALLPLCAIFLRKKGELYQESFLYEGSERLQLMEQLPLDMAMQVGFFTLACLNTYMNISRFSSQAGYVPTASSVRNTLRTLAGLTFSKK